MKATLANILGELAAALSRVQKLVKDPENRETLEKCRIAVLLVKGNECPEPKPGNPNGGHHGG